MCGEATLEKRAANAVYILHYRLPTYAFTVMPPCLHTRAHTHTRTLPLLYVLFHSGSYLLIWFVLFPDGAICFMVVHYFDRISLLTR